MSAPGQTLIEKVLAKASGTGRVAAGDLITAKVDLAYAHDSSGPRRWKPILDELGVGPWDRSKIAIVSDHYVPAVDAESAAILKLTRDFAHAQRIDNFFDMEGICHLVLPQHGLIRPGMFVAGGDSHTPMAGAFGAYAAGFGATDMAAIVATGETWLSVPGTIRVEWQGVFGEGVVAKDVMLFLCRALGMDNAFLAIEFAGSAVSAMSMESRMVLSNMSAELGAETGIIAPDMTTLAYLADCEARDVNADEAMSWASDANASYVNRHVFEASSLVPQIAAPHAPDNSGPADSFGSVAIDQAYIGACVGAKLEDLRMAAEILKGRKVASGVRLLVAPASRKVVELASKDGTLGILAEAGAILLASGCGACAGMGAGILADGEVCISSTNRNFKGRMGHAGASVYLGSPYSVAAAAVNGSICDPREMLASSRKTQ